MKKIRVLKAEEIECRPQSTKNGKTTMLLYIDSRAATDLLDECYGMENWTIEYKDVAGQIYGRLSIYDEKNDRWIYREDTGSPANIEKEKSIASDILKRCIARFGVTELYTAPRIVIEDDGYGNSGYRVDDIKYNDNRQIIYLKIVNKFGKEAFTWSTVSSNTPKNEVTKNEVRKKEISKDETLNNESLKRVLTEKCTALKLTGEDKNYVLKFFNYYSSAIEKGWKGKEFNVDKLWDRWVTNDTSRIDKSRSQGMVS